VCAYGLSSSLKKIKGVTEVTVSLNRGEAVIKLAPDNKVTLRQIREVVRQNGFSPKDARTRVAGKLFRKEGALLLNAGGSGEFALALSSSAKDQWQRLQILAAGQEVVVFGHVPADPSAPPEIQVLEVSVETEPRED